MLLREKPIASPLNYVGGKYKLLPQLFRLFPEKVGTFVDLFCGGCNVGTNAAANRIICNDSDARLIGLFKYFQSVSYETLRKNIDALRARYNLSDSKANGYAFYGCDTAQGLGGYNRDGFLNLRNDFNNLKSSDKDYYLYLYLLIVYAFNNQIRFNSNGAYNLPVGKRDFNVRMERKLSVFLSNIESIEFTNSSFADFDMTLTSDDFVYADPPYLITCASYNENNGWNEDLEKRLLDYLDSLSKKNVKFALSNVLSSKGRTNTILLEWIKMNPAYNCHHLDYSYKNSNYHKKDKDNRADEILITNYRRDGRTFRRPNAEHAGRLDARGEWILS